MEKSNIPDIFLISPVKNISQESSEYMQTKAYVAKLEAEGKKVHWPIRNTIQTGDQIGDRICRDNFTKILQAREIHVWYDPKSRGSHFDFGGVFMLLVLGLGKKIVCANEEEVKKLTKPGEKSFENLLLALHNGKEIDATSLEN